MDGIAWWVFDATIPDVTALGLRGLAILGARAVIGCGWILLLMAAGNLLSWAVGGVDEEWAKPPESRR